MALEGVSVLTLQYFFFVAMHRKGRAFRTDSSKKAPETEVARCRKGAGTPGRLGKAWPDHQCCEEYQLPKGADWLKSTHQGSSELREAALLTDSIDKGNLFLP